MALPFLPRKSPVLQDLKTWFVSLDWDKWFQALVRAIDATGQVTGTSPSLTAQGAAIPPTAILTAAGTGLYRVSNYVRITRAAGVSSSLTVLIHYTDGGVACTFTGATITANTVMSVQTNVRLIHADQGTPIELETSYASAGIPSMQYRLDVRVEALP